MRVHSTYEVNTRQQQNPFVPRTAASASAGKTAAGLTFEEHLKLYFSQSNPTALTQQAETQTSGVYLGYYPSLKVQQKPEATLEASAK